MPLSKSDFKIASSCAKKLVYKKANYVTKNDANEYMEMLAKGGHIVGKYAQLMYPVGIEIKSPTIDDAIAETRRLLSENENIILFEATIFSKDKVVRIDILEKKGNVMNLIEVKSGSHDGDEEEFSLSKKHIEYVEDVAYQTLVLREAYPDFKIHSFLLLPDKSKRTTIDGLAGWFSVNEMIDEKFEIDELPAENIIRFKKPLLEFKYENDPDREKYVEILRNDNLLALIPLDDEVEEMMGRKREQSDKYLEIINLGIRPEHYAINKNCKKCEFNLGKETEKNGYKECWDKLAGVDPSIFDLYSGGSIGHYKSGFYFNELISAGKVSFWDLDIERFKNKSGELSTRGQRQLVQYEQTKLNQEWIGDGLRDELEAWSYPLFFIDFETCLGALPPHKGMRPYELVTFQWSCHTIESPGAEPVHTEWLNTEHEFPNFQFAEALMNQIGSTGTPLMWSSFENTVLRGILSQMEVFGYENGVLRDWLINITKDKDREGRFVDMNDLTLSYYFHPSMLGRTSIKQVLPSIWNNNPYLHSVPLFAKYSAGSLGIINPYDTLSPVINELEEAEVVKDGTGAMRAYHELMFGTISDNQERKEQLKRLLLQYCELDTMAMVIIWKYWMDKCNLN